MLKGDPPLKAAFTAGMKDAKAPWSQKQLKGKKLEELTLALAAQMLQFLRMRLVSCFAENINQNRSKLHPFRVTNQLQRRVLENRIVLHLIVLTLLNHLQF